MRLLTLQEFSQSLGIKLSTARAWILRKKIRYIKIGRAVRVPEEVVKDLIRRGTVVPRQAEHNNADTLSGSVERKSNGRS